MIPWNKGKKGLQGKNKTTFKKGNNPWNKGKHGVQVVWNKNKKGLQVAWNKGKEWDDSVKLKMKKPKSEEHKNKLRKPKSEEHKIRLSETRRKLFLSGELKVWNKGIPCREESKDKIREKRLHRVYPSKDTTIEKIIQDDIVRLGIKFKKHYPIYGQPDIFIEPNICIFCDGDWWHGYVFNSKKGLHPIQKKAIERDKKVNIWLNKNNYKFIRFREFEIRDGTYLKKLLKFLNYPL